MGTERVCGWKKRFGRERAASLRYKGDTLCHGIGYKTAIYSVFGFNEDI